jgi:hypothetical protein
VRDVVGEVDLEDAQQQATVGREESDPGGHREADEPDDDVDGAEDQADHAVR